MAAIATLALAGIVGVDGPHGAGASRSPDVPGSPGTPTSAISLKSTPRPTSPTPPAIRALPVLLVHGLDDSCDRFGQGEDASPMTHPGPLMRALAAAGRPLATQLPVGNYRAGKDASDCALTLDTDPASAADVRTHCAGLEPDASVAGTLDEPLRHLGCALAWTIYDGYTAHGLSVDVVAHGTGGLLLRDALGESGRTGTGFPPTPLLVGHAVTLSTPHGGLAGAYADLGGQAADSRGYAYAGDVQFQDLLAGADRDGGGPGASAYMRLIAGIQDPQGAGGTAWTLLASAVPARDGALGPGSQVVAPDGWRLPSPPYFDQYFSLMQEQAPGDPYPDGDGVVQASSALAMRAQERILYGGETIDGQIALADPATLYRDRRGCASAEVAVPPHPAFRATVCNHGPFLLDDASTAPTRGWACAACGPDLDSLHLRGANDAGDTAAPLPVALPRAVAAIVRALGTAR